MTDYNKCCAIVGFVFLFVLLIVAIIWCSLNRFEGFANVVAVNNDNIKNKITGGKHYHALNMNEDLMQELQKLKGKKLLIAVLADWCGFCKKLKDSNVLRDVSKTNHTLVLNDKHPQSGQLMQKVQSKGFPTLILFDGNTMKLYEGPRDANAIKNALY